MRGLLGLIGIVGFVLWGIFWWAFDHFVWDTLIWFLEDRWHFREATLIASGLSYVIPLGGALLCIIIIYRLARAHVVSSAQWQQQPRTATTSSGNVHPHMTAYEVIHYLADDSAWGRQTARYAEVDRRMGMIIRKNPLLEAPGEFKRIAEYRNIKAIGRLNGIGQHVQIPETYWTVATLDCLHLDNKEISRTMVAAPRPDHIPIYEDVRISRKDVERAWPKAWSLFSWLGLRRC